MESCFPREWENRSTVGGVRGTDKDKTSRSWCKSQLMAYARNRHQSRFQHRDETSRSMKRTNDVRFLRKWAKSTKDIMSFLLWRMQFARRILRNMICRIDSILHFVRDVRLARVELKFSGLFATRCLDRSSIIANYITLTFYWHFHRIAKLLLGRALNFEHFQLGFVKTNLCNWWPTVA